MTRTKSNRRTATPAMNERRENIHLGRKAVHANGESSDRKISTMDLPERLFPANCYPTKSRLNIYSRPDYLGTIATLLKGSKEWERILNSQFGKLFKLPVNRCAHSGKLIHGLVSRQIVTKKKHELWFVFGGHPMRFSLREFHIITGLRCGQFPTEEETEKKHKNLKCLSVWNRLFGKKSIVTVAEVVDMLKNDKLVEKNKQMTSWEKLCLVLIVIIDGVVVCSNQLGRVTAEFVEMLDDIDFFMLYPWGRKAFNETMDRFVPPENAEKPIEELKKRLKQCTSCCYGFPLALQLQALQSIPAILERIRDDPSDLRNFIQRSSQGLSSSSSSTLVYQSDIRGAEVDEKLVVAHTLEPEGTIKEYELVWEDEVADPKVEFMLKLISEGHVFKSWEWPVGDYSSLRVDNEGGSSSAMDGVDTEDLTELNQAKRPKKPPQKQTMRKPLTRSSKKDKECANPSITHKQPTREQTSKPTAEAHVEGQCSDPVYVTHAEVIALKEWILEQNEVLRSKIREDMLEMFQCTTHTDEDPETSMRQSSRIQTNGGGKMPMSEVTPSENAAKGNRKRKFTL